MKGTLNKTESGWVVKYYIMRESSHAIHPNEYTLPILDNGYVNGPGLSDSNEGLEVEFEIVDEIIDLGRHGSTVVEKAKLVDKATRPLTEDDAWPEYPSKLHQLQIKIAEECFRKYPNNEELYTTDELKDAYKAGVIDGFKEAQNYNPPTKKQD